MLVQCGPLVRSARWFWSVAHDLWLVSATGTPEGLGEAAGSRTPVNFPFITKPADFGGIKMIVLAVAVTIIPAHRVSSEMKLGYESHSRPRQLLFDKCKVDLSLIHLTGNLKHLASNHPQLFIRSVP